MSEGIRVIVVNEDGDTERMREVLRNARISISCVCPIDGLSVEKVLQNLDPIVHGTRANYDAIVIEPIEKTTAEEIACAVIDKIPWQRVIIIGKGPMTNSMYTVSFVSNMLGVVAELKRQRMCR